MGVVQNIHQNVWAPPSIEDLDKIKLIRHEFFQSEWPNDRFDVYYRDAFTAMFLRVFALVSKTFAGDGNLRSVESPWIHPYPTQFYEHVKSVAHPDSRTKHWEGLLRNQCERVYLVHAVILKVLFGKIVSSLLFGASLEHAKVLESEDMLLLDLDGFNRSKLRAHTNEAYLKVHNGTPPLFWDQVDKITAQIAEMLLPLYNIVGGEYPRHVISWQDFYTDLHNIVAHVGWLNVASRISLSIIHVDWASPGDALESDQVNLWHPTYLHSRDKAMRFDDTSDQRMNRRARVKISAAPKVIRYRLREDGGDGYTSYVVFKPHCVYYQGLLNDVDDEKLSLSLKEHLSLVRTPRALPPILLIFGFLWCLAIVGVPPALKMSSLGRGLYAHLIDSMIQPWENLTELVSTWSA